MVVNFRFIDILKILSRFFELNYCFVWHLGTVEWEWGIVTV